MEFEWGPNKNEANIEKHGISFRGASRVLAGLHYRERSDTLTGAANGDGLLLESWRAGSSRWSTRFAKSVIASYQHGGQGKMSEENIVRHSLEDLPEDDQTDWERVDNLTDEEIEQAVAEDPDGPELLDEEWFRTAELVVPGEKKRITMRVNQDVIDYFKRKGRGYQTRMNAVLKAYVMHQKRKEEAA